MSRNFLAILVLLFFVMPSFAYAQNTVGNSSGASAGDKLKKTSKKKGKNKAAAAQNKTVADEEVDFAKTVVQIAEAYKIKQYATALVYCEQAMDKIPASIMKTERVISLYMLCFELYDKNEKHEKALNLAQMIRSMSDDEDVRDSICFSEATTLTKLHRWQLARTKYEECPGNNDEVRALVKSNVAELFMIEGDPASAAEAYRNSLALEPRNPHAIYGLAVALSRQNLWDEARKVFLSGIEVDPGFKFLEDAFFVPDCENDYQTAFRMYEIGRFREAKFYLERYVKNEDRPAYRQHGQKFLERIAAEKNKLEGAWPILLRNVTAISVSPSGQNFAFASLERGPENDLWTEVYLLDGAENNVVKRAQLAKQRVISASFMPDGAVRLLGTNMRYELMPESNGGYFVYPNDKSCFPLGMMPDGREFLCVNDNGMVAHVPWLDPYNHSDLIVIPNDSKRVAVDSQYSSVFVQTPILVLGTDVAENEFHVALSSAFDVNSIAVHPTKKWFALGIQSGTVLVDEKGSVVAIWGSTQPVERVAFDPSGKHLAALSAQTLEVWSVPECEGE